MLNLSDGIDNMGGVQWEMALALFVAWVIAFFCMIKGIKSSGKVRVAYVQHHRKGSKRIGGVSINRRIAVYIILIYVICLITCSV